MVPDARDPLLRFRPEFPILENTTYLISNSLGAMPRGVAGALSEYAETSATRGVRAWAEEWWNMSVAVGDDVAPLGAPPGSLIILPANSHRRGGTVVDFEHALEVSRELNSRDVVVDYRPGAGIRMSPHFYTLNEELDRSFEAIDEIRASGAWERWSNRPAIVT
jgi:kynureninase